jgi:hypothetical protein
VEELDRPQNITELEHDVELKGIIAITLRYIKIMRRLTSLTREALIINLSNIGAIPEKALKGDARSHQVTLGEPRGTRQARSQLHSKYVSATPFATFRFKHGVGCGWTKKKT